MAEGLAGEQVDVSFYKGKEGEWRIRAAVGTPGTEHARAMNANDFEADRRLTTAALDVVRMIVGDSDSALAQEIRQFSERNGVV